MGLFGSLSAAHAEIPAGYYDSANTGNQQALHTTLHEIIDDHQRFPYTSSSTDTWDILESADEDPDNSANVIDIYKNASYPKVGGGNTSYNREHTWPKSYGFPNDGSSNYPYTDTHHLFISDSSYNSSRSNKPYANCTSGCSEKTTLVNNNRGGSGQSSWTAGSFEDGSWQTWSGRKGDTARALMYMAVRYEGGTHGVTGVSEPDLILTDDRSLIGSSSQGSNISVAYMGLKSVLLQWHKEDPVDAFEQRHNDTVYLFQGNRNPFVDHPEYATCVFENICNGSGDTTPPSAPTGLNATGGDASVSLSWTANTEGDLRGYNIYRSNTSGGATSKVNTNNVTATSFSDSGLAGNTSYYYTIKAVDTSFNASVASNEASATTEVGVEPPPPAAVTVWINEFHYDNDGTDSGEAIEIAGTAGSNLSGWSLVGYNGNGGSTYTTINLSGVIADQQGGLGTLSFTATGLQNGAPDAIALVDSTGTVVQFLSYEGTTTATNGPASGQTSTDVGVSETSTTPAGYSLQLGGSGDNYADFNWQSAATSTFGGLNNGQSFTGSPPTNQAPTAAFSQNCNALSCTFDGSSSSDTDGTITSYNWDFGDGSTGTGVNPTHAYALDGQYNVVLTVTDNGAATDTSTATVTVAAPTSQPWVNEFHYDNDGTDSNEGIEIAAAAGTNLSGWSLVAYNGSGGTVYSTTNLSGTIADQQGGFGTLNFAISGLQNGAPDGFALVDNTGAVVQFLSYEGAVTAVDGPAAGTTSTDVGVTETSSTPIGHSLQLGGSGSQYSDFAWQTAAASTPGSVNNGQTLGDATPPPPPPTGESYFENTTTMAIPDRSTIVSNIAVERTGAAGTVDISVDISHTFRGDISLILQAPDGSLYLLKASDRKDGAENINASYSGDISGNAAGTWSLQVTDNIRKDTGQLNSWSLQF